MSFSYKRNNFNRGDPGNNIQVYLFCILLIGIVLRLFKLGSHSLWFDEAFGFYGSFISGAFKDLATAINFLKNNPTTILAVLYQFIIHLWRILFGNSEFILRLPSVIFGVVSIFFIFLLGCLLFNSKKAGLISAYLLSISPFHIYYSQELRTYPLMGLLSVIAVYFLQKALRKNSDRAWIGYVIANTLNIYIHFMAFLTLLVEISYFLIYHKTYKARIKKWLLSNFFIIFFIIPWGSGIFSAFMEKMPSMTYCFWIPKLSFQSLYFTFKNLTIGYNAPKAVYFLATAVFFALFIRGALKIRKKEVLFLLMFLIFAPIIILIIISQFSPFYLDRFFFASGIFYYLIVANGLGGLRKTYLLTALITITVLSSIALNNYYKNYLPGAFIEHVGIFTEKDYRNSANYLIDNFGQGDRIYHTSASTIVPFFYYFNKRSFLGDKDLKLNMALDYSDDGRAVPFEYDYKKNDFIKSLDSEIQGDRIWLVYSHWYFEERRNDLSFPANKAVKWMDAHFIKSDSKEFNGVVVSLYTNK